MSFFPEALRKTNLETIGNPSPCEYNPSLKHAKSVASVPFGSTQKLNRSVNKQRQGNPEIMMSQGEGVYSINNLNIKIQHEQQISSMFKSSTRRFQDCSIQQKPGPGQYDVDHPNLTNSHSHHVFREVKPTVPSIPIDNLGFKEDENNQMKKVEPREVQENSSIAYPTTSLKGTGVVRWKAEKLIKRQGERYPGPGEYNNQQRINKSVSSCFASSTDRFGQVKKIKEERIPGPGSYNAEGLQRLSYNISNEAFFNSKVTRFANKNNESSLGPGSYFNQRTKSHSVNHIKRITSKDQEIVNKTTHRSTLFEMKNNNPGPGQYKTNNGISYQLHKNLLRKQTTDILPREKRVTFQDKEQVTHPGPGTYENTINKEKGLGKLWKKTSVINLKQQDIPTPSPITYQNAYKTIEQKVKQMNSKLSLTDEKAFNSGTQRFKHYSNSKPVETQHSERNNTKQSGSDMATGGETKKVKRLVMTMVKVRVPFGMSSNKYEERNGNADGPGFYSKPSQWLKPTFNIKSKLQ